MNFNHLSYFPGLFLGFIVFATMVIILEKRFFKIVKMYWFYRRSKLSYISTFFLLLGIGGLLLSLMDARGPEEKIKTPIPTDRTIILIDTSASMLAEDVKPSRLQKAVLIAKHFARKAAGHQLSVVAFAEIQKKIVPFTNDLDLIDSRLDSLKLLRNQNGSSALSAAIQECIQYFKESDGEPRGNILVLTDGEETAGEVKLNIPKEIHVALVGVGTSQGGRIPLDDSRGFRFGYKKDKGQDVITKLNEKFFQALVSDIPSGKYWMANSYTLPSDEIMDFFKSEKANGAAQQDMIIKPVMMEWIVVPALGFLILSYLFKAFRIFSLGLLLIVMPLKAEEKEIKYTPELLKKMNQLQKGELNKLEKIKLADNLYKAGAKEESLALYEENLPVQTNSKEIPEEAYLNYGTALLEKGDAQKGLSVYERLSSRLRDNTPKSQELRDLMDKNIVSFFKQQEQKKEDQKNQEQNKKDNQDQKDQKNQDQKQDQSQGQGKPDEKKDQKGQQSKSEQQNKDQQQGKDKEKDEEKKGKEKKDEKKEENKEQEDKKEQEGKGDQQDDQNQKPLPQKKIPAKLKQLMSDDRQLQMKMIENGTRDLNKSKSRKNKDW